MPRLTHLAGLELGTGVHLNIVAPEQAAAELRETCVRALVQRVSRAAVRGARARSTGAIGPGLLVLLGVTHDDDEADADRLADKVRALRVFPDADGRMNEPLGDREVLASSPVHALRRRPQGQPAGYVAAAPARASPSRSTSACATASARSAACSARMMEVELVNDGPVTLLLELP